MSIPFIEALNQISDHYSQNHNPLDKPSSLQVIFQESTKQNYELLTLNQKQTLNRLYDDLSKASILDHPDWVKPLMTYKKNLTPASLEKRVYDPKSKDEITHDLKLQDWENSLDKDEKEAFSRIVQSIQTETLLNLSDLTLTKIPNCLLTDPRFAQAKISPNSIASLPALQIGDIANLELYEQVFQAFLIFGMEQEIESKLLEKNQRSQVGEFLLENLSTYRKAFDYLGFILANMENQTELEDLLKKLNSFDVKSLDKLSLSIFLHSPSSLKNRGEVLQTIIKIALDLHLLPLAIKLTNYYTFEVLLEEGISPSCTAGLPSFYVIEYVKAALCIDLVIQKLTPIENFESPLAELRNDLSIIVEALDSLLTKAPFLSQEASSKIKETVPLLKSLKQEPLQQILTKESEKTVYQHRTDSLYMYYNNLFYTNSQGLSSFDLNSSRIIESAAQQIKECRGHPDKARTCYQNLLISLGKERAIIAKQDNSDNASSFGRMKKYSTSITELRVQYAEYGAKVFNFIKTQHEKWIDTQKQNHLDFSPNEWIKHFQLAPVQDPHPILPISIQFQYANDEFTATLQKEAADQKNRYPLSSYSLEIPSNTLDLDGRLPPFNCSGKLNLMHSTTFPGAPLKKDLEDCFVACVESEAEKLKNNIAQFIYLFSHAAPYNRGSAAIGEWFRDALFQSWDLGVTYGTSEKMQTYIYRPTSDLDALVSTFSEFEEDFIAKANTYPLSSKPTASDLVERSPLVEIELSIHKIKLMDAFKANKITNEQAQFFIFQKTDFLCSSSEKGHVESIKFLIENNAIEVNQARPDGATPLLIACHFGHKEIVELLLKQEDIQINQTNKEGTSPLFIACKLGRLEIVELLLKHKNIQINQPSKNGTTPLLIACRFGYLDIVELLLKQKDIQINQANQNGITPLLITCKNGTKEIAELLLQQEDIQIHQANQMGSTPFDIACLFGRRDIVELLLKQKDIPINQANEEGNTPLLIACQFGHLDLVELLLKQKDIKINQMNKDGTTPLLMACKHRRKEIVELLLKQEGIQINQANKEGNTPFLKACSLGHIELATLLIEHGADVNVTYQGLSPILLAKQHGHIKLAEDLEKQLNK